MKDERQVEEMAKIIDDRLIEARNWLGSMNRGEGYWIAQELIKHYQPKLPEGSVVLTKEEYKTLYNDERASYYRAENLAIENDLLNRKLIDARKKMAREILNEVYSKLTEPSTWKAMRNWWLNNGECKQLNALLDEIAICIGVEEK